MDPIRVLSNHLNVWHALAILTIAFAGSIAFLWTRCRQTINELISLTSDVRAILSEVKTVDLDGQVQVKVDLPGQPSGLGWLPSGDLLVRTRRLRQGGSIGVWEVELCIAATGEVGVHAIVTENAQTVSVELQSGSLPEAVGRACIMIAVSGTLEVPLGGPLGGRQVLSVS